MADTKTTEKTDPKVDPKTGERKVGNPMRDDDKQNQFRAPDNKPVGAIYGEDKVQSRPGEEEEEDELPEDTHPQKPGPFEKEDREKQKQK